VWTLCVTSLGETVTCVAIVTEKVTFVTCLARLVEVCEKSY